MRIAVFASGNGTNYEAIVRAAKEKRLNAEVSLLICDKPKAYVIERAKKYNTPTFVFRLGKYDSKASYEEAILKVLKEYKIDLICLAGYMKFCGPTLLNAYPNKIINIHPALLPAFKGAHAILDAYNYGVKVYGVTIHYVSEEIDGGKIISQGVIDYKEGDSLEQIEEKIHQLEHILYVDTINKLIEKGI